MNTLYHSTFTPSQSDPETLEDLFVVREKLAQRIMDGIRESATSDNKHQRLLIGPRGIGKTHLVALIYHRVRRDAELDSQLRIAWLPEDPYIAGYQNLLLLILQTLQQAYQSQNLGERLEEILDLEDTDRAELMLEQLLLHYLNNKTLLLIAENLDDILADLKESGQRKLRAFLQNHPIVTVLATATSLSDAVAERKNTFYGFFKVHTLDPFTVADAVQLLTRMAKRARNSELANALLSPMGQARIRAVHYLAGGNPRIYVIFYDFLTRESLDDLVRPFMKLIDELTPYYQARMSKLAPLQRSIIDILRRLRGAVTVKEIARQAMSTSQTVSTQLGKLKELGYVTQAAALGRSNYYELREPLMRLCLEVKEQHGRTVELFVQFLRVWYSETELKQLTPKHSISLEGTHLQEAIERAHLEKDPLCPILKTEFQIQQRAGNHQAALEAAEIAIQWDEDDKESWVCKAKCLAALGHSLEERLACWRQVAEIDPKDDYVWNQQDIILNELGRYEEALHASAEAVALKPDDPILNSNYAHLLKRFGRYAEAQDHFDKALTLQGEPKTAMEWHERGNLFWGMDQQDEALRAYCEALALNPRYMDGWSHLGGALSEQGRDRLDYQMMKRMTALLPEEPKLWSYLGTANADLGQFENALAAYDRALALDFELDKKEHAVSLWRAMMLGALGRHTTALEALEATPAYASKTTQFRHTIEHANTLMWLDRWEEGCAELDDALSRYEPHLWHDRNFFISQRLITTTQNPDIWRRFISVWLELFSRHGRLSQLGQGLVKRIRSLTFPWISDSVARAWYDTWKDLAGNLEEMALPLRLLKAGVEYKGTRDPQVLLELAQEERRLLEPWLINLFKEEPDEIDREMENLLHTVERRLTQESEEKRIKAFWQAPAPKPETLNFEQLLEEYTEKPKTTLQHLLPGDWKTLDCTQAEQLLRLLAAEDENGARTLAREDLRVVSVEQRPLVFSEWLFFQIHIAEGDRYGALDLMASKESVRILNGKSAIIHAMIQEDQIKLANPESQSEYTRFFCSILRGETGRFQILDQLEELQPFATDGILVETAIHPWRHDRDDEQGQPIYTGTVLYGNAIFQATLRLQDNPLGYVEMMDDDPIATNLPIRQEHYDGPLRFLT